MCYELITYSFGCIFPGDASNCPQSVGANEVSKTHGSSCYLFVKTLKNWIAARADCKSRNGDLATVPNQDVQTFMSQSISQLNFGFKKAWIGAHDMGQEQNWTWVSGI